MEIEFMNQHYKPVATFKTSNHEFFGNAEFAILEDDFNCVFLTRKTESGAWANTGWWPAEAIAILQGLPKVKVG